MKKFAILISLIFSTSFGALSAQEFQVGADRTSEYAPLLENKRVALVVNQTSLLSTNEHLLDVLLSEGVKVVKIFAPEHGFRGDADAGAVIIDGKDRDTGLPVISLYGKNYKPTPKQLADVDIVIFDIQDVGARFYTYISTMHYVMEACAQNNKRLIVLDRPNPNDYIDGPILDPKFQSFVGMHPIPVLHGMTVGELAQMINGEGWLTTKTRCNLKVIPMTGWKHEQAYSLPVPPSPNLPNDQAVRLYPSLCFFEATDVSIGRGTKAPFQIIGAPEPKYGNFTFTPMATLGASMPPQRGRKCYGVDLTELSTKGGLSLIFLLDFYERSELKEAFFSNARFMDMLAGNSDLRLDITKGRTEDQIRGRWIKGLEEYKTKRAKYLLYSDDRVPASRDK